MTDWIARDKAAAVDHVQSIAANADRVAFDLDVRMDARVAAMRASWVARNTTELAASYLEG